MKRSLKTKLRVRFVLLALLGLFVLLSILVFLSIRNNYHDMVEKSDLIISGLRNQPSDNIRYFSVKIPAGTQTVYPDTVQHVSVTAEKVGEYARTVLKTGEDRGFLDGYRYAVFCNENGTRIYFLSRSASLEMCREAAENLIIVSAFGLLAMGLLLIPLSGWAVRPILENHQKQKQFITAAGHELKTPLAVISTNAQLLAMEVGDNDWLSGIQKQVAHMTQMTNDLVLLSKAEEYQRPLERKQFSFSDALYDAVEIYRPMATQKNVFITYTEKAPLEYHGNEAEIRQLIQILLDNACKYCLKNGEIRIETKKNIRGISLAVSNPAETPEDAGALLQRFRRGENARDKEGFGLGLSIAEAIASRHGGHITVSASKGEFRVEVVLH